MLPEADTKNYHPLSGCKWQKCIPQQFTGLQSWLDRDTLLTVHPWLVCISLISASVFIGLFSFLSES